jgi:hypothetical protein
LAPRRPEVAKLQDLDGRDSDIVSLPFTFA